MTIGIVIQWPSCAWKSMSSRPLAWCTFSRVNTNAQSSRMNHWVRPAAYNTTIAPAMINQNAQRAPSSVPAHDAPRRSRASTSTYHHVPPQLHQLHRAAGDRRQPEELRLTRWPEVVVHGKLDEACAGAVEGSHHLDADDAGRRCQRTIDEELAAEHSKVAVGVAHVQVEEQLDDVVVEPADQLAVPRITAADLVALHDIDLSGGQWHEQRRFTGVVLCIAVGVEDPLVLRRSESTQQGLAVAAVGFVMDHLQPRALFGELVEHGRRVVGRSVVDHDDLDVVDQWRQCGMDVVDEASDRRLVVV